HAQNRSDDLLQVDALLAVHREDGRRDEESTVVRSSRQLQTAREELVSLLLADLDVLQDLLLLVCGCDGTHVRLVVDRIADSQPLRPFHELDRKSTRLNSSHGSISYAVF